MRRGVTGKAFVGRGDSGKRCLRVSSGGGPGDRKGRERRPSWLAMREFGEKGRAVESQRKWP